jgi:acyl carrier protein
MPPVSEDQIRTWIQSYVGDILGVPPDKVDTRASFDALGLDSSSAVAMVGDLEDWLDVDVDPALPYDHPDIDSLAPALADLARRKLVAPA